MEGSWPKAILLDLDDTIIAYDHGIDTDACWRTSVAKHVPAALMTEVEEVVSAIKARASWYWSDPERHRVGRMDLWKARRDFIAESLSERGLGDWELAGRIAAAYGAERDEAIHLFPDSVGTIQHLRSLGIKLALLTNGNSEPQWRKIRRFGLAPLFDCILVEGEFGIGKPEERVYRHALEQLGVTAGDAWMVGDNFEWEVAAPQRLGIRGIWVDRRGSGVSADSATQPFMTIRSLGDLPPVLRRMATGGGIGIDDVRTIKQS